MSINLRFTDHDFDGFMFGQMTMTGYKEIIFLERDYPEYGWKTGDMIVICDKNSPCYRIEPLFGTTHDFTDNSKLKTFRRYKGEIIISDILKA